MLMLILSRGSSAQSKNMLKDMHKLMPSILEHKHDQKNKLAGLLDLMDMNECNSVFYIETTKRVQYLWIAHTDMHSIRFKTYNQFTMQELAFPVNCSKSAGHKLIFDKNFDDSSLTMVKDLFTQVFVESEVFDRVLCFFYVDNKIWMCVYAIKEDGLKEVGPRMVLEIDKVLEKCLQGKKIEISTTPNAQENENDANAEINVEVQAVTNE